ncbi:MAG: ATP-binding protein [Lachnospiraceae bacterium]|nr:ATP-binding protein [Lachnospiraceae bacterium]
MFSNPFSPIFGGKPDVFFGRERVLNLFDHAMIDVGSDDRAIFITGTRGSGKTALLEQLSIRATASKRKVIDLGPENTIVQLIYDLTGYDEITKTINPQASVSVLGIGGGISGKSVSKTEHVGKENLQTVLLDACTNYKKGILVTVDEIQKVPIEDISSLCNAFQMASRKGFDIMLAVAGLPYAYAEVIRHEGCTYLRRATHEELGLFTWEETNDSFNSIFSEIKGLKVNQNIIDKLNQACYGHPYLMQLLGYHLILHINDIVSGKTHSVTEDEAEVAITKAVFAYEQRALKPLLDELPNAEKTYLTKMSKCLNQDRLADTSEIAKSIGKAQNQLSRQRAYLIDHGIIASPEQGKVMFCIPYLADYVKKAEQLSDVITIARERRV